MIAAEKIGKMVIMSPPMPMAGGEDARLPYPPGPDFSWLRGGDFRELIESEPANSTGSQRLVAGVSPTVGRMPWYIQVLFIIFIAIILIGSYFLYRYEKSKRLIGKLGG